LYRHRKMQKRCNKHLILIRLQQKCTVTNYYSATQMYKNSLQTISYVAKGGAGMCIWTTIDCLE